MTLSSPFSIKRSIRWGVISFFFTQGLCFASWASRIPDIKATLGLSDAGLGSVLFALPAGSMAGLPFAGWLVTRLGSKKVALAASILYVLAMVSIGFATMTWHLVVSLFLFGVGGNLVNISINTQAIGVENLYKKSIMASFHGAWSVAGFTGAAIGALAVSKHIHPSYHFIAIATLCFIAISVARHYTLRAKIGGGDHPLFAIPDSPLLKLGLIGFCGMACEGAMFDWSGVYFQKVVEAPAEWVTLGYVVFMCAMATGRFAGDGLVNRIGRKRMIQLSGILVAAGLLLSVLLPFIVPVTIGFLLVGFGISSVVPLVYSAAGKSLTFSPGMALAAVSTISFFGFLIGPPLIGFIAEASSLRYSFAVIAVLGLCTTLLTSRAKLIQ
ncbi:MAG TPA: MFS transporter [Chryseolinea sp.]|nr:MFS transporter [Chryseolinea sp.]